MVSDKIGCIQGGMAVDNLMVSKFKNDSFRHGWIQVL